MRLRSAIRAERTNEDVPEKDAPLCWSCLMFRFITHHGLVHLVLLNAVADDIAFEQVDHVLGDIGGVVGDALQVA